MQSFGVISQRKIYLPANECIYCGVRDVKLTDEHTFPDGLLGQHILPKASCEQCQKTINEEIEQYCMRTLFAHLRAAAGMRSKKKRPALPPTLKVKRHTGEIERVVVEPADLRAFALPVFPEPFFLTGEPVGDAFDGWWWFHDDPNIDDLLKRLNAEAIISENILPSKIARLVAKIAHAHAWALWGPVFEPFLVPTILGQEKHFHRFVGGWGKILEATPFNTAHTFKIRYWRKKKEDADSYLIAQIRFFSDMGGPVYYAVIGRALKPWPFPERLV